MDEASSTHVAYSSYVLCLAISATSMFSAVLFLFFQFFPVVNMLCFVSVSTLPAPHLKIIFFNTSETKHHVLQRFAPGLWFIKPAVILHKAWNTIPGTPIECVFQSRRSFCIFKFMVAIYFKKQETGTLPVHCYHLCVRSTCGWKHVNQVL